MSASQYPNLPFRARRAVARLVTAGSLLLAASGALAQGLRFTTENDIFTDNPTDDDLYTFAVDLEVERAGYTISLRENAFTDRAAGLRLDETYLDVARRFAPPRGWNLRLAAGLAHSGRGLLGERVQNALHRALDNEEVHLAYVESDWHAHLEVAADRFQPLTARLELGPRLELIATPGLRQRAAAGLQATWRPRPALAVEAFAGARWARASRSPLEPHLDGVAPAGQVGLVIDGRWLIAWSYNDQGDEREHWTVGWLLPAGDARGRGRAR